MVCVGCVSASDKASLDLGKVSVWKRLWQRPKSVSGSVALLYWGERFGYPGFFWMFCVGHFFDSS